MICVRAGGRQRSHFSRAVVVASLESVMSRRIRSLPGLFAPGKCPTSTLTPRCSVVLRGHQFADVRLLLVQFGIAGAGEVGRLKYLADLDVGVFVVWVGDLFRPVDGFFEVLAFPNPEAGDQFLRFREGTVD